MDTCFPTPDTLTKKLKAKIMDMNGSWETDPLLHLSMYRWNTICNQANSQYYYPQMMQDIN